MANTKRPKDDETGTTDHSAEITVLRNDLSQAQAQISDLRTEMANLRTADADIRTEMAELRGRFEVIDSVTGELRASVPRIEKTLTAAEVRTACKDDPSVTFRSKREFKHLGVYVPENALVRATDRPNLAELVQSGLMLVVESPVKG